MNNMMKIFEVKIKYFDGEDYICIIFQLDLFKFKMEKFDKDIVVFMIRRVYDLVGFCKGVKVMFNGKKLFVSVLENILIVLLFCRFVLFCFLNFV